jgi:hypothetical protein
MLPHKSLEDRLNAVKNGKPIPNPPVAEKPLINNEQVPQQQFQQIMSLKQFFFSEGYKIFNVLSSSILYGYGIRTIFSQDWNFIGSLGVGFLLNHALTFTLKLIRK